ncbi:pantoate--beta-alanine ligase [Alkalicoccus saliphilus]|uniref:Pantothenate synthetase n=1 Tax=Alkalicoccus saliphilus TaxID=200989 RepID=A0A2T4UAC4_9BACI|nr:pantoate--beta-alanine ligase [Alkalicoccus saliphilus]PTL40341.1 pantoate--beta-alanine ligase [Alkalicoccus saliphilus]
MKKITTIREMQKISNDLSRQGNAIGFVPTMGYLHEGHMSLVDAAAEQCDTVVMSIFVNPLQFGEGEDFESYPRNAEGDRKLAEERGVDILFIPDAEEMYPRPMTSIVKVKQGTDVLCGASRPGHFDGVATVVMKLFQAVRPSKAFFGQKDAQQVAVVSNMVEDYHLNIEIIPVPVKREKDGLAMSSRNVRLLKEERREAPLIYKTLIEAAEKIQSDKISDPVSEARSKLAGLSGTVDYLELRTYPDLKEADGTESGTLLLAAAVKYEQARLIDNVMWNQQKG